MNSPLTVALPVRGAADAKHFRTLRISCWGVALVLGAAQAWATRFTMNPDGVSYLDIGDAYWRGDWHNAINAYWSPLYSWILGFFLKVLRPSAYWEYPLVHLVNLLIYVGALACFEFLLVSFVRWYRERLAESGGEEIGLSESSWWLLGYSLFLSSSILMIGLGFVTPDMCVAAFVFLATALVLKISNCPLRQTYVALGLVLGFASLTKGVLLPLSFAFLGAVLLATGFSRSSLRNATVAFLVFLCVVGPFGLALSYTERRLTFGDVGPVSYEMFIDRVDVFAPDNPGLLHPVWHILDRPTTIEFGEPIPGTYPLWYNPTYWHAGLKPQWRTKEQLDAIRLALRLYFQILTTIHLNLMVPFLALLLLASQPWACCKRIVRFWPLTLPALAAVILYSLVYAEPRYLGPFFALLWLAAFSGLRFPDSQGITRFLALAIAAIAATAVFFMGAFVLQEAKAARTTGPVYWEGAEGLNKLGTRPGDKLAVFGPAPFGEGGAFVARLGRAKIVIQSRDTGGEWSKDATITTRLTDLLGQAGVKAALWYGEPPVNSAIPWQRLGQTPYYVYFISDGNGSTVPD